MAYVEFTTVLFTGPWLDIYLSLITVGQLLVPDCSGDIYLCLITVGHLLAPEYRWTFTVPKYS